MSYTGLSLGAKLLWARLAQYAGQDGACYPSQKRLASDLGLSDRQIRRLISELNSKGFLEKEAPPYKEQIQGKTVKYFFLHHPIFRADKSVLPGRSNSSGGYGQICPGGMDKSVLQRDSDKEKKEENSFFSVEEGQKRVGEILTVLGRKTEGRS
jgi:DNA-binding transcriptional MocR family regulator